MFRAHVFYENQAWCVFVFDKFGAQVGNLVQFALDTDAVAWVKKNHPKAMMKVHKG